MYNVYVYHYIKYFNNIIIYISVLMKNQIRKKMYHKDKFCNIL